MSMDIKTFMSCARVLPIDVSVLIRGDHGVGKSKVVAQLATEFSLPLLDKRLSQMSEGDMVGLPELKDGVTRFAHPDWYIAACDRPMLLFFDELNRALPEVMQAGFQIVLDRELNGRKLHPETRVYAAINMNARYQVNDMDPALLDRFWCIDLEPSVEDWLVWAKDLLHKNLVSFIATHKTALDPSPKAAPNSVDTSRRSMERLDSAMKLAGLYEADMTTDKVALNQAYQLALGFVGTEVSTQFTNYLKTLDRQITAEDILDRWSKVASKIPDLGQEKYNICCEKLVEHSAEHTWTIKQAKNFGEFVKLLPGELVVTLWQRLAQGNNSQANVKTIHPYIGMLIVKVMSSDNPPDLTPKKVTL